MKVQKQGVPFYASRYINRRYWSLQRPGPPESAPMIWISYPLGFHLRYVIRKRLSLYLSPNTSHKYSRRRFALSGMSNRCLDSGGRQDDGLSRDMIDPATNEGTEQSTKIGWYVTSIRSTLKWEAWSWAVWWHMITGFSKHVPKRLTATSWPNIVAPKTRLIQILYGGMATTIRTIRWIGVLDEDGPICRWCL